MKKVVFLVFAALLFFKASAFEPFSNKDVGKLTAQEAQQKFVYCLNAADLFRYAANSRDTGETPQQSLERSAPFKFAVPDKVKKSIINTVYFDQNFARAGGEALHLQQMNYCMYGQPAPIQPLK